MRRSLVACLIVAMVSLTVGFRSAGALNVIFDDRVDWTGRSNGTVGVLGDSVGYGLVRISGLTDTLAANSWGPVRSYTLAGLHAAPEGSGDPHNVATWINTYRAQGIVPRVMVVVTGSNDVGWPQGDSVARNQQRIETAMAALGTTEVVWPTITHHNPAYEGAWNQALINAAAKWPNLHLCDWRSMARANAGFLSNDQVHPTGTGYRAMRDLVMGCVTTYGSQARFLGAPAFGPIGAAGGAGKLAVQTPSRVLDTRQSGNPLGQAEVRRVHVAPPGSTAAALNLTSVGADAGGFLTAFPCGQAQPFASNLNYKGAAPVGGGVTVGVDAQGDVCIFSLRPTHLVVDVQGTYRGGGGTLGFTGNTPNRLADSRSLGARVGPGSPLVVNVGAAAAWLNITAVDAAGCGLPDGLPVRRDDPLRVERQLPRRPPGHRQRRHRRGQREQPGVHLRLGPRPRRGRHRRSLRRRRIVLRAGNADAHPRHPAGRRWLAGLGQHPAAGHRRPERGHPALGHRAHRHGDGHHRPGGLRDGLPRGPGRSGGLEPQPRGLDADGQRRHHSRPEPRHRCPTATRYFLFDVTGWWQ